MFKRLLLFAVVLFPISSFGQADTLVFKKLFNHFKERNYNWLGQKFDSVTFSSLYKTESFNVSISEDPIYIETDQRIIKNPYFTDDFDDYDDNYINYPVSYSVIYEDRLISLFRNGRFVVHRLKDFERDIEFEEKLNGKRFSHHWVIDGKLYARTKKGLFNRLYVWLDGKWQKADIVLPVKDQPILFDDEKFMVFNDCFGEWGGTVYFFDRQTRDIFFTESTCANTVRNEKGNYLVLAHLGHMSGYSELKSIEEPRRLTKSKKSKVNKPKDGAALGYTDKSDGYEKMFDYWDVQLFSNFIVNKRKMHLTHLHELTFLSEIQGSEIQIVHPLFNNDLYTHGPITTTYGDYTLINLDFWGTARDREVSVLIIEENKITKLDWNERHSH